MVVVSRRRPLLRGAIACSSQTRYAGPAAGEKGPPQAKRGVGCPHLRYSEDSLILFPDSLRTRSCPIFSRHLSAISLRYPTANSLLRTWCARVCACACGCKVVKNKPHGVQTSAEKPILIAVVQFLLLLLLHLIRMLVRRRARRSSLQAWVAWATGHARDLLSPRVKGYARNRAIGGV